MRRVFRVRIGTHDISVVITDDERLRASGARIDLESDPVRLYVYAGDVERAIMGVAFGIEQIFSDGPGDPFRVAACEPVLCARYPLVSLVRSLTGREGNVLPMLEERKPRRQVRPAPAPAPRSPPG